jgi:hypothetical protein
LLNATQDQYDTSEFIERMEAKDLKPELERAAAMPRRKQATAAERWKGPW